MGDSGNHGNGHVGTMVTTETSHWSDGDRGDVVVAMVTGDGVTVTMETVPPQLPWQWVMGIMVTMEMDDGVTVTMPLLPPRLPWQWMMGYNGNHGTARLPW